MKKFWELNKIKLLVYFIIFAALFGFLFYNLLSNPPRNSSIFGRYFPLLIPVSFILNLFIYGSRPCRMTERLINDSTEKSIITLFDNGFTIDSFSIPFSEIYGRWPFDFNFFSFKAPCLKGTISGLPVVVSALPSTRIRFAYIDFSFTPLLIHGVKTDKDEDIWFNMGKGQFGMGKSRLNKDIKPNVLEFVDALKEKGYTSAL